VKAIRFLALLTVSLFGLLALSVGLGCDSDGDEGGGSDGDEGPSEGDVDCERGCLDERYQAYAECDYQTWDCIKAGGLPLDCGNENESCRELVEPGFGDCVLGCNGCFSWNVQCQGDCYASYYDECLSECEEWRRLCGDECYRQYEICLESCGQDDEQCESECETSYGRCVGVDCEQGYRDCDTECFDSGVFQSCLGDCYDAFYECATWFDFGCERRCNNKYAFQILFLFCSSGFVSPEQCRTKTDEWLECVKSCY